MIFKVGRCDRNGLMKMILMAMIFLQGVLLAGEMEVRCYRVGLMEFGRVYSFAMDDYSFARDGEEWLGEVVTEMPFESRFLKGVESVRDCTKRVEELVGRMKFEGTAVYDSKGGVLVLKAEEKSHEGFGDGFGSGFPRMIRTEVSVYTVPGVMRGRRSVAWESVPEGAELLTKLSCLALPGQSFTAGSTDGGFLMEGEVQIDGNDDYADNRATWTVRLPEASFSWKTGFISLLGVPWVYEVGSLDGKKTVLAVMKTELVLMDGTLMDEWILKEEGGAFLLEERLARLAKLGVPEEEPDFGEGEVRRYTVPPTFETFITYSAESGEDDPFATTLERKEMGLPFYEGKHPELEKLGPGKFLDCQDLLKKNGVSFGEGDFVVYLRGSSLLFAKLSEINHELLDGIVKAGAPHEPRAIRLDFLQVEMDGDGAGWKAGDGKVLKKVGISVLPGQMGEVTFGGDLAFQVEAQIDGNDDIIEVRATLSEVNGDLERASFRTGVNLRSGVPILIQESGDGASRRAWIVRGTVVKVGDVLERE